MKRIILVAIFTLAISSSCSATVARGGSCAAGATSCTFSSTATGTLKIVYAIGSVSPSVPGGWTLVLNQTANASAFFVTVGCNISSSSGDTGSGTWTNAVRVIGISYTGTGAGTTANCNTTGIGAIVNDTANGTTVRYDAVTLQHTNGTSWVVGLATGSATVPNTPTGMTNFTTVTNSRASDTNAAVSSWSQQTVTVATERWTTNMLEIQAASNVPQIGGFLVGP